MGTPIETKGAYIEGQHTVKGKPVALAFCKHPDHCKHKLSYLSYQGDPSNFRLTNNLFGIPTKNDPYRCILFTQQGAPHPDPGKQGVNQAAVCGMALKPTN